MTAARLADLIVEFRGTTNFAAWLRDAEARHPDIFRKAMATAAIKLRLQFEYISGQWPAASTPRAEEG